uniref:Uncharacterized protein n=1 Tax=Zea mays TaxID=4577 RepID=C0HJ82_MAIZE|nr:unknown [Zea mays]
MLLLNKQRSSFVIHLGPYCKRIATIVNVLKHILICCSISSTLSDNHLLLLELIWESHHHECLDLFVCMLPLCCCCCLTKDEKTSSKSTSGNSSESDGSLSIAVICCISGLFSGSRFPQLILILAHTLTCSNSLSVSGDDSPNRCLQHSSTFSTGQCPCCPVSISAITTPRLYISNFFETCPLKNSGAKYPTDPTSVDVIVRLCISSKHLERPKSDIFGTMLSLSSILGGLRSK